MQSELKHIYNITANRTGINEQIYKDLGNFVLKEVHKHLEEPQTLIIKVKGIGYWYLSKKRMEDHLEWYPSYYEIDGYKEFTSEYSFLRFVDKQKTYKIFKARLVDYQEYLKVKAEIKSKKDEFNKVHKGKEESPSSSKGDS